MQSFKNGMKGANDEELKEEPATNLESVPTKNSSYNVNNLVSEKDSSNQLNRRTSDKI